MFVARHSPERQPLMPLSPQDRVRLEIEQDAVRAIAEWLVQHQKANRCFRLSHLKDDAERAVFLGHAMEILSPERRLERARQFNELRSHGIALADKDQQDVEWQAKQDVIRFGNFGFTTPGNCAVCKERVDDVTDHAVLELSATLKADVHASCCIKDEARFEVTPAFSFRLRKGARL